MLRGMIDDESNAPGASATGSRSGGRPAGNRRV